MIVAQKHKGEIGERLDVEESATGSPVGSATSDVRGPGSTPPNCESKCGSCTPCKRVLVAVSPLEIEPMGPEYYPIIWMCECVNKLYKP
uniref:Epidermal patterning factor-like protein n=1 Tax=Cajanus cajan TaxID=3821 RepID=A0A151U0X2_CAJCA|nr:Polygalacturonase [Cajanus cajan]